MKQIILCGVIMLAFAACHSSAKQESALTGPTDEAKDSVKTYNVALLDNKKDPVCGMPAPAGMEDTIHVNGKVIGFCSKGCKDEYLKNPKGFQVVYK